MAPLTRRRKKLLAAANPPPVINPADRLSKLPEEILAQILSFLPAQEAVRTCVLARTWRHVWKFTRHLLITAKSVQGGDEEYCLHSEDMSSINRWIHRALECQIQMLRIHIDTCGCYEGNLEMSNMPLLVSRHLTKLELVGVWFTCRCINLDGCPALEHLEINECDLLGVRKIMSLSLKRLVITSCDSNEDQKRIQICVPRLVSLWLDADDCRTRTPLLDRMPDLVGAKVRINSFQDDCNCDDPVSCYHIMRDGYTSDIREPDDSDDDEESPGDYGGQNTTKCIVLEGLAQARDLVLIDDRETYIFRRDFRWCPTFCKLKTLVLSQVRHEPVDCSVLECMVEHAPLLEKVTLILKKVPAWQQGKYKVEIKGYPDAKGKSTKISQHLQIVNIICEDVNGIFENVLKFLSTLNICFETRVTMK